MFAIQSNLNIAIMNVNYMNYEDVIWGGGEGGGLVASPGLHWAQVVVKRVPYGGLVLLPTPGLQLADEAGLTVHQGVHCVLQVLQPVLPYSTHTHTYARTHTHTGHYILYYLYNFIIGLFTVSHYQKQLDHKETLYLQ